MDVVSSEARSGLPSELLCADDPVYLWHQPWSCWSDMCYLGDTLDGNGGADLAATARIQNNNNIDLSPISNVYRGTSSVDYK